MATKIYIVEEKRKCAKNERHEFDRKIKLIKNI